MASIPTLKSLSSIDKFIINGAVTALNAPDHIRTDKDKMVRLNWLGDLIEQGLTDFNFIKNCSPVADNVSTVDSAKLDATASVAVRAEAVALDAINKVAVVTQSISAVAQQINDLSVAVHKASVTSASNLDEDKINAEVASAIAKAFKPFAQAVKDAKAEAVVANATKAKIIDRKSALRASSSTCSCHKRQARTCGSVGLKALVSQKLQDNSPVALDVLTPVSTSTSTPLPMIMRVL